jgi:hypothetical protein
MKLSITIAVAGLLLAPALFSAVEGTCWRARATYGLYQANAGSALCFGQEYPQVSPPAPISYVWLLHGNCSQAANRFQRYSIGDPGTWTQRATLPYSDASEYVGWGGALAYGPDPYPTDSGRIFAFTGNNTDLFWLYSPSANQWYSRPSVLHAVGAGGALCYGGIQSVGGVERAVFYALVGGGYPYFYRYSYPMDSASDGTWYQLANLVDGSQDDQAVNAGGALAWIPRTDSTGVYPMGQVFALVGFADLPNYLYCYNPATNAWRIEYDFGYDLAVDSGAAMSPGGGGYDVRFFLGGHSKAFLVWDPASRTMKHSLSTHYQQNAGAALCEAEAPHSCHAVFGEGNCPYFEWHNGTDSLVEDGGQSRLSAIPEGVSVKVRAGSGEHRFTISCAPGAVSLKVVDAVGRVAAEVGAEAGNAGVELAWRHGSARPGVYFYTVVTQSGSSSSKLVVPR